MPDAPLAIPSAPHGDAVVEHGTARAGAAWGNVKVGPHLCQNCGWPLMSGFFDDARHEIVAGNERRYVTPVPWNILQFLRSHPGCWLTTGEIHQNIYRDRLEPPDDNVLRVHIHYLRPLLAGVPFEIASRAGGGYKFDLAKQP